MTASKAVISTLPWARKLPELLYQHSIVNKWFLFCYTHTEFGKIPSFPNGIIVLSLSRNFSGINTRKPLTRDNSVLALAGSVSAIDFSCMNISASWNDSTWLLGRHLNTCKNRVSEWVSDCCLMPTQQFFSYIMARTR